MAGPDRRDDQSFIPAQFVVFDQQRKQYNILAIHEAPLEPNSEILKHSFLINDLASAIILARAPVRMHLTTNRDANLEDMILQVPDHETVWALSRHMKAEKPELRADHYT